MKDQTEVCPLSGTGMFHPVIRTITARHSLSPSSLTCTPDSSPYGSPALAGRDTGLPSSIIITRKVKTLPCPPVAFMMTYPNVKVE